MTRPRLLAALALLAAPVAAPAQSAASPLDRGVGLFNERRYADARAVLMPVAKAAPNDAAVAYWIGRAFYEDTAWNDAERWFERAVKLDDRKADYHFWLGATVGEQAQRAGKLRQPFLAKRVHGEFERAVELDPNNVDARVGLIRFYTMAPGIMGGSIDKARQQAAEVKKRNPYLGGFEMARLALHDKDTTSAAREYLSLVQSHPDSTAPYYSAFNLYAAQKRDAEMWQVVDRLLERQPDNPSGHYLVGRTAAATGQQLDRGEREMRAYLRTTPGPRDPSLASAHWRLGGILERRGDKSAARAEYEAAVRLDPKLKGAQDALKAMR